MLRCFSSALLTVLVFASTAHAKSRLEYRLDTKKVLAAESARTAVYVEESLRRTLPKARVIANDDGMTIECEGCAAAEVDRALAPKLREVVTVARDAKGALRAKMVPALVEARLSDWLFLAHLFIVAAVKPYDGAVSREGRSVVVDFGDATPAEVARAKALIAEPSTLRISYEAASPSMLLRVRSRLRQANVTHAFDPEHGLKVSDRRLVEPLFESEGAGLLRDHRLAYQRLGPDQGGPAWVLHFLPRTAPVTARDLKGAEVRFSNDGTQPYVRVALTPPALEALKAPLRSVPSTPAVILMGEMVIAAQAMIDADDAMFLGPLATESEAKDLAALMRFCTLERPFALVSEK